MNDTTGVTASIAPENIQRITRLAGQLTNASRNAASDRAITNPFKSNGDPTLDPSSAEFDPKHWAETVITLMSNDSQQYLPRKAGVSFRNLSVSGFGSPTGYQKDFINVVLQVTDLVAGLINRKDEKIQILRNHNGLLRSGEMLLVLGRPGR